MAILSDRICIEVVREDLLTTKFDGKVCQGIQKGFTKQSGKHGFYEKGGG